MLKHKNRDINVRPTKGFEQLKDDWRKCIEKEDYSTFMQNVKDYLSGNWDDATLTFNDQAERMVQILLHVIPQLAYSQDRDLHKTIQDFYYEYEVGREDMLESRMNYVLNTLGHKSSKCVPYDWIIEIDPDHETEHKSDSNEERERIFNVRDALSKFDVLNETRHLLRVEFSLITQNQTQSITLDQLGFNFLAESTLYKLKSSFPKKPGVYALYYLGDSSLYKCVHASDLTPVYIGQSTTSIHSRLTNHLQKIGASKDLKTKHFGVRFVVVDVRHYAPCIEGMLIDYLNPIWNRETVGFNFGGVKLPKSDQAKVTNIWYKYHVLQDDNTIKKVDSMDSAVSDDSDDEDTAEPS